MSKIKVPTGLVSGEAPLLGLRKAAFLLSVLAAFLWPHGRESSPVSSTSYKGTNPTTLMTSSKLNYLPGSLHPSAITLGVRGSTCGH